MKASYKRVGIYLFIGEDMRKIQWIYQGRYVRLCTLDDFCEFEDCDI